MQRPARSTRSHSLDDVIVRAPTARHSAATIGQQESRQFKEQATAIDATIKAVKRARGASVFKHDAEARALILERIGRLAERIPVPNSFSPFAEAGSRGARSELESPQAHITREKHVRGPADTITTRRLIVARLRESIGVDVHFADLVNLARLPWRLMPPAGDVYERIASRFVGQTREGGQFDGSRIKGILRLRPAEVYDGTGEFCNYFAFLFPATRVAVLESPVAGNALYVVKRDWYIFCRLSKATLLGRYGKEVERVVHGGDWLVKLQVIIEDP